MKANQSSSPPWPHTQLTPRCARRCRALRPQGWWIRGLWSGRSTCRPLCRWVPPRLSPCCGRKRKEQVSAEHAPGVTRAHTAEGHRGPVLPPSEHTALHSLSHAARVFPGAFWRDTEMKKTFVSTIMHQLPSWIQLLHHCAKLSPGHHTDCKNLLPVMSLGVPVCT